jgi:PAS domain S-box-containing protein
MMRPAVAWRLSVLGFTLACVVLALIGWSSYRRFVELREATRLVDRSQDVRKELEIALLLLIDAETGQRGFLITGESSYLEPYNAALAALPPRLERLRRLTADNPRQRASLAALEALIQSKVSELSATIVVRQTTGLAAAGRLVLTDEGKRIMDRTRAVGEEMRAEERRILADRAEREERAARAALITTVSGLGLALALALSAAVLLNQAVRARGRADGARLQAEAVARATATSEERLRVTLASIGDAVIATDGEGRVTLMNPVAEVLTGWAAADGVGRRLEDVFVIRNEDTRRPVDNPVRRVLREGVVTGLANHTVLVAKDGREVPIDDSAAPIRAVDGTLLGAVMVFRDIAQRRQAERERAVLLQREREARVEVERSSAVLRHIQAITDTALLGLELDALVRVLLARTRAALASDTATLLLLEPDGRELVVTASDGLPEEVDEGVHIPLGRGVAGRIATSDDGLVIDDLGSVEVVSPLLRSGITSLVGAPLRIEGRLIGVIHAGSATPRRFGERDQELLRIVASRAALVLERTRLHAAERSARAAAEAAGREAEAANRTKDQFLAVFSHELRTPLTTMLGWLRMLRGGLVDPLRQARALEAVERNTEVLAHMIDDLLDISRIAAGKMPLERERLSLGPLVAEAIASLEHEATAKKLTLESRVDPAAGPVLADRHRMRQVLMNLLVNAIKYTPAGGRVQVDLTEADGFVRVVVRDTGVGIDRDLLPHVFERFRQANWRAAGTEGGLGLGLAIVREIVEMHRGTVAVQSDGRGRGASFIVTLPSISTAAGGGASAGA